MQTCKPAHHALLPAVASEVRTAPASDDAYHACYLDTYTHAKANQLDQVYTGIV